MEFTKMHGLGNDFIVVFGEQELPSNAAELAVTLCNRFFGIGADGLVYILPSERGDFMMRIMNSDGSEAEQCGNAIRCVSKYVYDHGLVSSEQIVIETIGAGEQKVTLNVKDGVVETVTVDMGEPVLSGLQIPVSIDAEPVLSQPIEADGTEFTFTAVSMGNPHCVIYVEDAVNFDLATWGPKLEVHPLFPRKVNVEFATVLDRGRVDMRVWERGAGPTLACGTGACATLVSSVLNDLTDRAAWISLKGGDLYIEWNEEDNHVYMTGPAEVVFTGSVAI
ncbi:diaminopimelate epimerase [Paenibacillus sp. FSL R7-0048]|jgi:diaminopimelate epimerase|uniref:diaminopimelate epimerase n=1 Tax=Paenibacillus TaxID=44249 RepID=UPI00096D2C85|nr:MULTISPECIES: diaminopimelate epimerase [Paenibacillus]MDH6426824.1 diaminopimelate epimerase [Paenibacillus sp. PastH-4]MDH6442850.1 diaminopimelate epimerase [Paenibacillus sp. PastF-4]MDH6526440.1 diaminopimelate epimerase [Paenibacillus sp. PastH-3]OMC69402.1 diaminopimelate epimerase [Paenibacillus odorifer]OMD66926.1 diaminopimelate epimerase [Paenibacillus odorifer]